MKHLMGPGGRAALDRLCDGRPLLAFDFDGTLCALQAKPDDSRTLNHNLPLLRRLARRTPLAIISGRSVRDLHQRLHFEPTFVVGNHGLEGLDDRAARRAVKIVAGWRAALHAEWAPFADDPGVFIEDKVYSLSLHFRLTRDPAAVARHLRDRIARLTPKPRIIGGKYIFNLTLAGSAHKGGALTELIGRTRARRALFVGDDVTDEDGFRVRRAGLLGVRVNRSTTSAADWYVRELAGVTALLRELDERIPD